MKSAGAAPPEPRSRAFTTISGRAVQPLYTARDLADLQYDRDLADPGVFPYPRGIHASGYHG